MTRPDHGPQVFEKKHKPKDPIQCIRCFELWPCEVKRLRDQVSVLIGENEQLRDEVAQQDTMIESVSE